MYIAPRGAHFWTGKERAGGRGRPIVVGRECIARGSRVQLTEGVTFGDGGDSGKGGKGGKGGKLAE